MQYASKLSNFILERLSSSIESGNLATVGVALCLTRLPLDFPNFSQEYLLLQISHPIHVITALVLIAFAFGHAYIGSIAAKGALNLE